MPRSAVCWSGPGLVSFDGGSVRQEVHSSDGGGRRVDRGAWLPLHVLRHSVPPAILQLWLVKFASILSRTVGESVDI